MSKKRRRAAEKFHDAEALDEAVKQAVRRALEEHKRLKNTVAAWDGRSVILVPPENIPDAPPPERR
jgi:hypothetical protein